MSLFVTIVTSNPSVSASNIGVGCAAPSPVAGRCDRHNGGCSLGFNGPHWLIEPLVGQGNGRHSSANGVFEDFYFIAASWMANVIIMDAFSMIHVIPVIVERRQCTTVVKRCDML